MKNLLPSTAYPGFARHCFTRSRPGWWWLVCLGLISSSVLSMAAADGGQILVDFREPTTLERMTTADAKVSCVRGELGAVLRVDTGHQKTWPGITLKAPTEGWDLSTYGEVVVHLRNGGAEELKVFCRVDNDGADGRNHCVTDSLTLPPGGAGRLRVALQRTQGDDLGGRLFGMRGYPVKAGGDIAFDPARVTQLLLFLHQPATDHRFEVEQVRAEGVYHAPTASTSDADPFFPFIDKFGQYQHRDWPGKVQAVAELHQRREAEAKILASAPGPEQWNRYGGWADGPQLEATGFFRTQKHEGKWWLVDPEGRLFFSHGVDCVRMIEFTPITERESWFVDPPGAEAEMAEFILQRGYALMYHYAGRSPQCFSFGGANLQRKYGPGWREVYTDVVHRRLRHWGLNTIGLWSDGGTRMARRTPYVDGISSRGARLIEGSSGYWGKFPDVFDPSFKESVEKSVAGRKGSSLGDPWCLGFFSDNELAWGDEVSLAMAAIQSPADQPAKQVFQQTLQARYGSIEKLNQAWGTTHASWPDWLENRQTPDPTKARPDLADFYTQIAQTYFRTIRDALRQESPHQLYLGCRFAWVNDRAARAAARSCDVVSFNLYRRSVADFAFNGDADVPLIIGEFHFGALDRGMFHTGLGPVATQAARAQAYRDYVEGALRHPNFVGCHWFQYMDQPTLGRVLDGENYQIGLVDIADTPYPETIAAVQAVGRNLYPIRASR